MNECLRDRLARLLEDEGMYQVDIRIKCKTKDGMIYTLYECEYRRETFNGELPYADCVHNAAMGEVLDQTELIGSTPDGLTFSPHEMVSIRNSEIVRVWAELGDLYTDTVYKD